MIKRVVCISSLIIAIVATALSLNVVLGRNWDENDIRMQNFHNEPSNSLDVVVVGASDVFTAISAGRIYEETGGMRTYPYAVDQCPSTMWKLMVEDIRRTQPNALIVLDVYGVGYEEQDLTNGAPMHHVMDGIPFKFIEKYNIVNSMTRERDLQQKFAFVFPYAKYHSDFSNYKTRISTFLELAKGGPSPMKGMFTKTTACDGGKHFNIKGEQVTLKKYKPNNLALDSFNEFLDYCDEEDVNIIFTRFPSILEDVEDNFYLKANCRVNYVAEIIVNRGYEFINFQQEFDEIGLKETEDFYNSGHVNYKGQRKFSTYFARIIKEYVDIEKNSSDEWDEAIRCYHAYYQYCENLAQKGVNDTIKDTPEQVKFLRTLY